MSNLADDAKFKADIFEGYEALSELLQVFNDGAGIYKHADGGGFVDMKADDLNRVLDRLEVLKTTLKSLIVGKDPSR